MGYTDTYREITKQKGNTMRYIEKGLLTQEKLVYGVRPHWIIFSSAAWTLLVAIYLACFAPPFLTNYAFFGFTVQLLTSMAFLVVSIYWWVGAYIYYKTSEYGVTNKRVVIKTGWIKRVSLEVMLDKVEAVLVDQSIMGRILGYGAITIIGTGGTNDRFPFIPNPMEFRRIVQEQIDVYERDLRS